MWRQLKRFISLYGFVGLCAIKYIVSAILSIIFFRPIVKAFNLINGKEELTGTTGIVLNCRFNILFMYMNHYELAALPRAIMGAVIGFLRLNLRPAEILTGDIGNFSFMAPIFLNSLVFN